MILQLLFQILILLSWQKTALAQPLAFTTKSVYSISIPFPFALGVYRSMDSWFYKDSIFDRFLRTNIAVELEVHEFSIQENHGYIVKFCRTRASLVNTIDEGKNRDCEFGFFLNETWLESISNSREEANKLGAVLRALGWYKSSDWPYFFQTFDHGYSSSLFPVVKENINQRNTTLPLEIGHEEQLFDLNDTLCYDSMTIFEELIPPTVWLILLLCTGIFIWLHGKRWLLTKIKKRKDIKIKMELLKRNGGLLLQKSDGSVHRCQIFNLEELNIATEKFNVNRELGHGGQGTVYKGILEDGRMVGINVEE